MEAKEFTSGDKMSTLINANYQMLNVLSRFEIGLGVGEKTIGEICKINEVDCNTFLAVVNLLNLKKLPYNNENFSIKALIDFLKKSHTYFTDYRIPAIKTALENATHSNNKELQYLILNYFNDYAKEVQKHMNQENKVVFPYLHTLLECYNNKTPLPDKNNFHILSNQHTSIEVRLAELIGIIVKYYPYGATNELNTVLYDIFVCQQELESHHFIEDELLVPKITNIELEMGNFSNVTEEEQKKEEEASLLSQREKDVLVHIVNGLTNKEIANKMFLSVHTVNTHRKNIMNKLNIHSPAGLTIYAIVNKLITLKDY
jgi:Response regulator containing a CheY-like receiver domain and an HTH DNA-binding domain